MSVHMPVRCRHGMWNQSDVGAGATNHGHVFIQIFLLLRMISAPVMGTLQLQLLTATCLEQLTFQSTTIRSNKLFC